MASEIGKKTEELQEETQKLIKISLYTSILSFLISFINTVVLIPMTSVILYRQKKMIKKKKNKPHKAKAKKRSHLTISSPHEKKEEAQNSIE